MAKPSSLPTWATDTNLASGTQSGSTTKLEPSAGYKAQGCVPGKSAPGRYMNWLLNLIYQWCAYLDNLHAETDFLNKDYTWTGDHDFGATIDVTGDVNCTGTLSSDAGVFTQTDVSALGDVYTDGDFLYSTPPTRSFQVPLFSHAVRSGTWSADTLTSPQRFCIETSSNSSDIVFTPQLPRGAVITQIAVHVHLSHAASSVGAILAAFKATPAENTDGTVSQLGSDQTKTTSGYGWLTISGLNETVSGTDQLSIVVRSNDTASSGQFRVLMVTVDFEDPGPRNY